MGVRIGRDVLKLAHDLLVRVLGVVAASGLHPATSIAAAGDSGCRNTGRLGRMSCRKIVGTSMANFHPRRRRRTTRREKMKALLVATALAVAVVVPAHADGLLVPPPPPPVAAPYTLPYLQGPPMRSCITTAIQLGPATGSWPTPRSRPASSTRRWSTRAATRRRCRSAAPSAQRGRPMTTSNVVVLRKELEPKRQTPKRRPNTELRTREQPRPKLVS